MRQEPGVLARTAGAFAGQVVGDQMAGHRMWMVYAFWRWSQLWEKPTA